jgi:predicted ATPase
MLPYLPPEQTGQVEARVDFRADYYALGATLYEMLTGHPPFAAEDPAELVHAHIARAPVAPAEREGGVPHGVSDLVLKLLAKDPADRYQSASGLLADLEVCLARWREGGAVEAFPLARRDVPERLEIPERLYGRARELDELLAAYERVRAGGAELLLVAGDAGVGKTALVREARSAIVRRGGHFVGGKYDQLERSVPCAALIEAFRELMRQVLTEDEASVATWRGRLLEALGPNGQVLVDLIPELAWVIGPQPPVPQLRPTEAQNRFNLYFQKFVAVFARAGQPLAVFLDDLQWADTASLDLVHTLMTGAGNEGLLLLAAYRDKEVADDHPLPRTLAGLRAQGTTVAAVRLRPLARQAVAAMIADALRAPRSPAAALAALVLEKTRGNPFFVRAFLRALQEEGVLRYRPSSGWSWDLREIAALPATENVVELMARKIARLQGPAQDALRLAACIGNRFELGTLATASAELGGAPRPGAARGPRDPR